MTAISPSSMMASTRIQKILRVLGWILVVLCPVYFWIVARAPVDSIQGMMQKILYVHPPPRLRRLSWVRLTAIAGGLFLWKKNESHDQLAIAGAEVGTLFCSLMLITGPIWARGAWGPGNWWVWGRTTHPDLALVVRLFGLPALAELYRRG